MKYPNVYAFLPRLMVPTAPMWQFLARDILIFMTALGLIFGGTYIQRRIDAYQIADLQRVIQVKDEQLAGKRTADGLAKQAKAREGRR